MSEGKRAALELAESSRDPLDERGSFASNLFIGRFDFDRIALQSGAKRTGSRCRRRPSSPAWENTCTTTLSPGRDRSRRRDSAEEHRRSFPMECVRRQNSEGIRRSLGSRRSIYGSRCDSLLGSWDANLTALVSAHQSIGVPQPLAFLRHRSTKKKYLPGWRAAKFPPSRSRKPKRRLRPG